MESSLFSDSCSQNWGNFKVSFENHLLEHFRLRRSVAVSLTIALLSFLGGGGISHQFPVLKPFIASSGFIE